MRNLLAGLAGVIWAAWVLLWLSDWPIPNGLYVYGQMASLLAGLQLLSKTPELIVSPFQSLPIILAWLVVGAVSGLASRPGWNLVRSAFWSGAIVAIAAIAAGGPAFWASAERNIGILGLFLVSVISAQLSLLSAVPVACFLKKLTRRKDRPAPEVIETVCECGARFRSNPLICSECGRRLRNEETR